MIHVLHIVSKQYLKHNIHTFLTCSCFRVVSIHLETDPFGEGSTEVNAFIQLKFYV